MGGSSSKLEKALENIPEGEHYFGLENFGNTCYANSVLQMLYFCEPFRNALLYWAEHAPAEEISEDSMLLCLALLFQQVSSFQRIAIHFTRPCDRQITAQSHHRRAHWHARLS